MAYNTRMKTKICGVYKITSPSGKFYIGSSVDIHNRWNSHKRSMRSGKHGNKSLMDAGKKYGIDNMKFEIVCLSSPDYVRRIEQDIILWLRPHYNLVDTTENILIELWQRPDFRARNSERTRAQNAILWADPKFEGYRKGISDRAKKNLNSPDSRAKSVETQRRLLRDDPDYRARRVAVASAMNTDEIKAKSLAGRKSWFERGGVRVEEVSKAASARMRALESDPEFRRKRSEGVSKAAKERLYNPAAVAAFIENTSKANRTRIRCIDTGRVFDSFGEAAAWAGLTGSGNLATAVGVADKRRGGYLWELVDPPKPKRKKKNAD